MRLLPSRSLPRALVALCLLAGCEQQEGERCEIQSDCAADLVCEMGICSASARPPTPDAAPVVPDASVEAPVEAPRPADAAEAPVEAPVETPAEVLPADAADAGGDVADAGGDLRDGGG